MRESPQSTQRAHARTLTRPRARKRLKWERTFYRSLRRHGTITRACADAKIARMTWYGAVARHPDMAERADDALEAFADLLEAEAVRRAVEGVEEPYQIRGLIYEASQATYASSPSSSRSTRASLLGSRYSHSRFGGPCMQARAMASGVSGIGSGIFNSRGRPRLRFGFGIIPSPLVAP